MRIAVIALIAAFLTANVATAQDGRQEAAQAVISAQIDAFRNNDFDRAFGYASPGIQGLFGTPENFGAMVRGGYAMVLNPKVTRFGEAVEDGTALLQRLYVEGADGAGYLVEYRMQPVGDGWRIAGVKILPAPVPSV